MFASVVECFVFSPVDKQFHVASYRAGQGFLVSYFFKYLLSHNIVDTSGYLKTIYLNFKYSSVLLRNDDVI